MDRQLPTDLALKLHIKATAMPILGLPVVGTPELIFASKILFPNRDYCGSGVGSAFAFLGFV